MHNFIRIFVIVSTLIYLHPFWRMYFNQENKNDKHKIRKITKIFGILNIQRDGNKLKGILI